MLFILNKSYEVVGTLNSEGDLSKIVTYFDDSYVQDLGTGAETYQFSTLANTEQAQHLIAGNFVAFKEDGEFKLFNIIQIEETHEETFIKTVYCEMAGIELINEVIRPIKILNSSLKKFLTTILEDTEWQLGKIDAGFTQVYDFEITDYSTVYELIQEYAVGTYGAEISYRVELEHGRITGKYIDCYAERGSSNGFRFAYGSNLTSVVRTVDMSNLATALIGVGNNNITFKEVETGDKPLNQDFIVNETAFEQWNVNGNHIFGIHQADTDSPQELLRLTRIALEERANPQVKYEMKAELLGKDVKIGDTVNVIDHEFNPPLYLSARVNQLTKSKTNPYDNEVVLANFKEVKSNITSEMRQLASQLEGYVDSQFPIGGDKIQNGAIGKEQFSKQYHTEIVADAVYASMIEVGELVATKIDVEELNAVYAEIEELDAKKATIEELYAQKAEIDELIAKKADIESLKAITANIETLYTEKANVTDLNALNATVTNLKAEKADIEDLTAQKAEIEELVAKKADIDSLNALEIKVNTIDATKATISDLNATNAIIGSLQANKADIVELDAVKGNIEHLTSEVADINTLVNGNLTSDNIHSLILSSDKVTVEDAFIKNAMIDAIDANKIKAGSLDTGLVTISSPTGGIVIADNTQQFKDKNGKVRVQIGEDKNGEFNFSIYDETGVGVLIDHTGVKEHALGDNIIKENMISSNAVGQKQIDYNSFTTGFNEETNTNTLNATKVKLDSTNQTLEVGFNSLKTQADDTKSKTESNTTKLEVQQGQIQSLISDTTIEKDGESIKIKDAYSEVVQKVDEFGVTMGEHSTKITEIGNKADNAITKATDAETTANSISGRVTEVESKQSTLKQDLDGFKTSVSENYSTKAELKATSDKVGTLEGTVNSTSSKVASIETDLSSIAQRVSSTETTTTSLTNKVNDVQNIANSAKSTADSANNKIDGLQVGNANLFRHSDFSKDDVISYWGISNTSYHTKGIGTYSGFGNGLVDDAHIKDKKLFRSRIDIAKAVAEGGTYARFNLTTSNNQHYITVQANTEYTFSYWVYKGGSCSETYATIWKVESDGSVTALKTTPKITTYTGSFVQNSTTFTTGDATTIYIAFYNKFTSTLTSGNSDVNIYQPLLTMGNKIVDWTPSKEDVEKDATDKANKALSDAKTFTTTEIKTTNDKVSQLTTDLSGITGRVSNVETTTTTIKNQITQGNQNIRCNDLGAKINYSTFTTSNAGELYLHGYDANNNPTDTNGKIYWNGTTLTIVKGMINPNSSFPLNTDVFLFVNKNSSSTNVYGAYYNTTTKAWAYIQLIGGTASNTNWTPDKYHVAIGQFNMADAETFNHAYLYETPQALVNLTIGSMNLLSRMNSAELKITDSAIISTVTSTIESKVNQGIDNIQIGTSNLQNNSDFKTDLSNWKVGTGYTRSETILIDGINTVQFSRTGLTTNSVSYFYSGQGMIDAKEGEIFTASTSYYCTSSALSGIDASVQIGIWYYDANGGTISSSKTDVKFVADKWVRFSHTSTAPANTASVALVVCANRNGLFYIGKPKLERGNKASDWSLSVEDIENSIYNTETVLNGNIDNAVKNAKDDVLQSVGENYTSKEEFKSFNETVTSSLKQTSEDITATFETAQSYTKEVDGKLQSFQDTVGTHIRFSTNGIDLGKTDSPFTATLDNTQLAFKENGQTVAYISNNKMHITQAEIKDNLRIGSSSNGFFTWVQGSSGNLSLKWSDK